MLHQAGANKFDRVPEALDDDLGVDPHSPLAIEVTEGIGFADALRLAMYKEKRAFRLYMKLADVANDQQTKEMLVSLADDEARHRLQFEVELEEFLKLEEEMASARKELLGDA